MKKQNLLLLTGLGYYLSNKKIELSSRNKKKKNVYILEDYEYYNDFLFEFNKYNDIYLFNLNEKPIFKLIKTDDNFFDLSIKYKFFTKKIKLNRIEFDYNKYILNLKYRPNLVERISFKLDNKEINIDFRMDIGNDFIIFEILNVNEIDNILTIIKNYNFNLFEYLKRNNYKLIFKNKF
jgi:hypothetical protein